MYSQGHTELSQWMAVQQRVSLVLFFFKYSGTNTEHWLKQVTNCCFSETPNWSTLLFLRVGTFPFSGTVMPYGLGISDEHLKCSENRHPCHMRKDLC